jgi:hypothetical protein
VIPDVFLTAMNPPAAFGVACYESGSDGVKLIPGSTR